MPHWSTLTLDPMDPRVITRRQDAIRAAHRPVIHDRTEYLSDLARGKRVLDVGVVDHDLGSDRAPHWLHVHLARAAREILGVDVLESGIAELRDQGYAVECMDITAGDRPHGLFDLIVAGEVVEHLPMPGGLYDAASALLDIGGRLVITTPNPHVLWRIWQHLRDRPYENVDHVTFHTPSGVVEQAERAGLRLDAWAGLLTRAEGRKGRIAQRLVQSPVIPFGAEAVCECLLYEVVRSEPS